MLTSNSYHGILQEPLIRSQIEDDRTYNDPTHYGATFVVEEERGTAHTSVIAANGDAVAATSTINT